MINCIAVLLIILLVFILVYLYRVLRFYAKARQIIEVYEKNNLEEERSVESSYPVKEELYWDMHDEVNFILLEYEKDLLPILENILCRKTYCKLRGINHELRKDKYY